MTRVKNNNNLYPVNFPASFALKTQTTWAGISKQGIKIDIIIWHHQFAYLNKASIRHFLTMIKIINIGFFKISKMFFCKRCIEGKITCQQYYELWIYIIWLRYPIYDYVEGGSNIYIFWKSYKYLLLVDCGATNFTLVKFLKKKSETLLAFMNLIPLCDK